MTLQKKDNKTVAVNTAEKGIPVCERMEGLTTMMYIVAKNELTPARISVFWEVGDIFFSMLDVWFSMFGLAIYVLEIYSQKHYDRVVTICILK